MRHQPKPYVLYHDPCSDGFGAAYCAWKKLGEGARYVGVQNTRNLPNLRAGADIFMVDVSFKLEQFYALSSKHPNIVVIDHHLSSEKDIREAERELPPVKVCFDKSHSASVLAWKYFFPEEETPALLSYIEDRDLWNWKLPQSKEVSAALFSYPRDFLVWDNFFSNPDAISRLAEEGEILLRAQALQVESLLQEVRVANIGGYEVPAVNAPYFLASEVGHSLLHKYSTSPFSAVYRDGGNGARHWSLRSDDTKLDVSEIAQSYGGGGHRNAAAFVEKSGALTKVLFSNKTYEQVERDNGLTS